MLKCQFCQTSKAQKYIFTVCQHLICINCAALRLKDQIKCCRTITQISEQTRHQLEQKKEAIMKNLSNDYNFEETQISCQGIQTASKQCTYETQHENNENKEARVFSDLYKKSSQFSYLPTTLQKKTNSEDDYGPNASQQNLQVNRNKYDASYINQRTIKKHETQNEQPVQQFNRIKTQNNSSSNNTSLRVSRSQQIKSNNTNHAHCRFPFQKSLKDRIQLIKTQFSYLRELLAVRQQHVIQQTRLYYQEYIKALNREKENEFRAFQSTSNCSTALELNQAIELQNMESYFEKVFQSWKIQEIKNLIKSVPCVQWSDARAKPSAKYSHFDKHKQHHSQLHKQQQLQSSQKSPFMTSHLIGLTDDNDKNYSPHHRLFTLVDDNSNYPNAKDQNNQQQGMTYESTRGLDKIYKKLEESKLKLEERINLHHQNFASQRSRRIQV